MSLQFFGFQFLGHEQEVITFECDVLLCGDVTSGSCGEVRITNSAQKRDIKIISSPSNTTRFLFWNNVLEFCYYIYNKGPEVNWKYLMSEKDKIIEVIFSQLIHNLIKSLGSTKKDKMWLSLVSVVLGLCRNATDISRFRTVYQQNGWVRHKGLVKY